MSQVRKYWLPLFIIRPLSCQNCFDPIIAVCFRKSRRNPDFCILTSISALAGFLLPVFQSTVSHIKNYTTPHSNPFSFFRVKHFKNYIKLFILMKAIGYFPEVSDTHRRCRHFRPVQFFSLSGLMEEIPQSHNICTLCVMW
ncbi:hypothetical protein SDC9_186604 [bioreactor metagenome]|uniref:Uncharacterized protein n=1 Tax=bioreactor metagenome TaxID=1076179 RepID=A0A645HJ88_9ZZZZ